MANDNKPYGARPVRHLTGAPYNGQANEYYIPSTDSTATFVGDFVKLAGSCAADGTPTIAQAAAGDALLGVVVGFRPDPTNLTLSYRAASTNRYALVADSPDIIFEIQEDSAGAALVAADVGANGDIVVGTGSTTTGASAMQLDSSDVHTNASGTGSAQLRVLRLVKRDDNAIGDYAKWEVLINEHQLKSTAGV